MSINNRKISSISSHLEDSEQSQLNQQKQQLFHSSFYQLTSPSPPSPPKSSPSFLYHSNNNNNNHILLRPKRIKLSPSQPSSESLYTPSSLCKTYHDGIPLSSSTTIQPLPDISDATLGINPAATTITNVPTNYDDLSLTKTPTDLINLHNFSKKLSTRTTPTEKKSTNQPKYREKLENLQKSFPVLNSSLNFYEENQQQQRKQQRRISLEYRPFQEKEQRIFRRISLVGNSDEIEGIDRRLSFGMRRKKMSISDRNNEKENRTVIVEEKKEKRKAGLVGWFWKRRGKINRNDEESLNENGVKRESDNDDNYDEHYEKTKEKEQEMKGHILRLKRMVRRQMDARNIVLDVIEKELGIIVNNEDNDHHDDGGKDVGLEKGNYEVEIYYKIREHKKVLRELLKNRVAALQCLTKSVQLLDESVSKMDGALEDNTFDIFLPGPFSAFAGRSTNKALSKVKVIAEQVEGLLKEAKRLSPSFELMRSSKNDLKISAFKYMKRINIWLDTAIGDMKMRSLLINVKSSLVAIRKDVLRGMIGEKQAVEKLKAQVTENENELRILEDGLVISIFNRMQARYCTKTLKSISDQ